MEKKRIKTTIIFCLAILFPIILWFSVTKVIKKEKQKTYNEAFEQGYRRGWGHNTDAQLCLLGGKAALSGGGEIPFFRGCVTEEEAEEMGVSYTFTFKDWCEIYGDCEEVGYGYYDD